MGIAPLTLTVTMPEGREPQPNAPCTTYAVVLRNGLGAVLPHLKGCRMTTHSAGLQVRFQTLHFGVKRCLMAIVLSALTLLSATSLMAQDAALTMPELTSSGEAYLQAMPRLRIDTDVVYYDPAADAPRLTTQERLDTVEAIDVDLRRWPDLTWPALVISGLILAVIIFVFIRFGGKFGMLLQPISDNPHAARRARKLHGTGAADFQPRSLKEIIGMKDRRTALILLAKSALRKAMTANDLLIRQSWTDREALRRLPADQRHLTALVALIRASERVQFGGRDVSEPEFVHHVQQITPLFRELGR